MPPAKTAIYSLSLHDALPISAAAGGARQGLCVHRRPGGLMRLVMNRGRALWTGLIGWLGNLPIADPVDRSNAQVLQVIFICLLCTVPLMWVYRLTLVDVPLREGDWVALLSAGVITTLSDRKSTRLNSSHVAISYAVF